MEAISGTQLKETPRVKDVSVGKSILTHSMNMNAKDLEE